MKYVDDVGCKPPMTRVEFQTRGWKFSSGGIGPSDCARRMADAIAEATRRAAEQAAAAAEAAVDAARKTGEEIGRFSQKTFKVIEGIFKPERETRPAQVRPAFRITQEMENYRKLEGPAHCWNNSFWHQGYRTCMPLTGYSARQEMVLYVFDGSKKARCLTIQGNKNKNGQKLVLWDCIGKWSQQFRITPWDRKSKTTGKVRIINDAGKCVAADVSKKKAMFARIVLRNCSRGEGQRWIFRGGQLIGARNLCLRTKGRNVNGGSLTLRTCSADENPKEIEKEILSLREGIKQQTERRNHLQATPPPPPPGPKGFRDTKRYARDLEKYKRSRKNRTVEIAAIDKKLPGFMKKLEQLEHDNKKSNSSEPPVEWVRGPSMSSPGEAFAKKFKIAGSRSLRLKTGTGCVDNGDVYYRALTPYGVKPCNGKGQPINIGVVEKEYFTLVSKLSFHCLSVYGSLKADGTKIVSWPCLNTANQLWRAARPVSGDLKLANKSNKGVFKKNFMLVSRQSGKCLTALDGVGFDNAMKKYRRLYKNRVARAAYMARHKRDMPTPEAHSKKIFKSYWVSNSNSQFILGSCDARSQGQQFRLG